ncbi:hypothetical protein R4Z10_07050 [Niallia sp. XMNu-256]
MKKNECLNPVVAAANMELNEKSRQQLRSLLQVNSLTKGYQSFLYG